MLVLAFAAFLGYESTKIPEVWMIVVVFIFYFLVMTGFLVGFAGYPEFVYTTLALFE